MSESQGNNTLNRASSNMPIMNAAPTPDAAPIPPSNNMPFTASPAKPQPAPQVVSAMPQVGASAASVTNSAASTTSAATPTQQTQTHAQAAHSVNASGQPNQPSQSAQPKTAVSTPIPAVTPTSSSSSSSASNVSTSANSQSTTPATLAPQSITSGKPTKKAKKSTKSQSKPKTKSKQQKSSSSAPATPATPDSSNRQIDFFAEQNARSAEKKAKNNKIIKWAAIVGGAVVVLAIAGVIIWLVFFANKQDDLTLEEVNDLRFTFGDIYKADGSLDDVRQRYDEIMRSDVGRENADAVKLQLLFFYVSNGFMARGVEIGETIDVVKLSQEAKSTYYSQMYNAYATTGQIDKATAAQYESAILRGDSMENNDNSNNGGEGDNNGDSSSDDKPSDDNEQGGGSVTPPGGDSSDKPQVYICNGVEYSFPVECAVNGVEPNEF